MAGVFRKLSIKPGKSGHEQESKSSSPSRDSSPASGGPGRSSTASSAKHAEAVARNSESTEQTSSSKRASTFKSAGAELVSMPKSLAGKFHLPGHSPRSSSVDLPKNRDGEDMSKNQMKKHEKLEDKEEKATRQAKLQEHLHKKREERMEEADNNDPPQLREKYGAAPVNNYSGSWYVQSSGCFPS